MTDNLKPCPFCGGEGELERTLDRFDYAINSGPDTVKEYGWYVYCTKCDAGTYVINVPPSSPEAAIAAWNRRAPLTLSASASNLIIIRKALQRYRTRIEEVGDMGWYDDPNVTRQEIARVDAILAELEPEP